MRFFSTLLVKSQSQCPARLGGRAYIRAITVARSLSLDSNSNSVLLHSQRFKANGAAEMTARAEKPAPLNQEKEGDDGGATGPASGPGNPNTPPSKTAQTGEGNDTIFQKMTAEELLRGSQQAYYALGSFLNELSMGMSGNGGNALPNGTTTPAGINMAPTNPLLRLQTALTVLQRTHPDVVRPSSSEVVQERERESNPASWPRLTSKKSEPTPQTPAERVKDEINRLIKYLRKLFPMTKDMAGKISSIVSDERNTETYLLQLSGPQDYIVQSQIVCGGLVHDNQITESFSELIEKPFSSEELKKGDTSTPLLKLGEESEMTSNSPASETDTKTVVLFSFPPELKAKAYVMVRHAVVVPPQRHALSFDWFYRRIAPGKSENERILAAKHFAVLSDSNILSVVDFIARMFTGSPMLIKLIPQLKKSLKLPETDLHTAIPVVHKEVVMVLTEQGKWLIDAVGTEESLAIVHGPTL